MPARQRLDAALVQRGLAPNRQWAREAVAAGQVLVDGTAVTKPTRPVSGTERIDVVTGAAAGPRYVSRAGGKLRGALDHFALSPAGLRCLDAGASTGGFTDCLLQAGAARVVAVDVGTDQLHPRLAANPRVERHDRTDVRTLTPGALGGPFDLVVADLSFISLRLVLDALAGQARPGAPVLALVKPQFEVGRPDAARSRGIIRDPALWRRALGEVAAAARDRGMDLRGATVSGIRGAGGNVEFMVWWAAGQARTGGSQQHAALLDAAVTEVDR